MHIGIIGAGQIGGTLARKLAASGHSIRLANSRGPASLSEIAQHIGATATTVEDALKDVEVVIVSVPEKNVPDLPRDLFATLPDSVVVVDTGNYYPGLRDGPIEPIEAGMPESVWVSQQLGRPVVKAFNNIIADSLSNKGRPTGAQGRIALPVSGEDPLAKRIVFRLVDQVGFDALDAGDLQDSWRQQPGAPAYCTDLSLAELPQALAAAQKRELPKKRDLALQKIGELQDGFTSDDLIKLNRSLFSSS